MYYRSPVWAQNALVTLYGWTRARKRFGGNYQQIYNEIRETRSLSSAEHSRWLADRLHRLLEHAGRSVPYYRGLYATLGFSPDRTDGVDALRHLPILTKADVRRLGDRLRSEGGRSFWRTETSGSTGTPLTVELDSYAYRLSMALLAKHESDHGIDPRDRRATFAGRLVQPVDDDRPPFWRYNWAEHQLLCSAYHMSDRNLPSYLEALNHFQPVELIGYPSAIYTLADYCRRTGTRPPFRPRIIVTNSESLLDWQRSCIEEWLGAPVFDYYGSAESVVFAAQCSEGSYHPDPLMGVCEVLDEDGQSVPPGNAGRLVCTTTSNYLMPLIRYDTGDWVVTRSRKCECGVHGAAWQSVLGRTDDVVVTPEGRSVGRLDHIFKGVSGIREAQIAHTEPGRIVIRVVPDVGYDAALARLMVNNAQGRLGAGMKIDVELVTEIARTARGKFRAVVREF